MFNFLKKKESVPEILPKKGEKWIQKDNSPWPKDVPPITTLDCKDGWVRYSFKKIFTDERMELSTFKLIYMKVEE